MKKIIALCGALALGGCAELTALEGAQLTTNQVYVASNAFDAAELTAVQYLKLPDCTGSPTPVCRTPAAVTAIANIGRPAYRARETLVATCATSTTAPACVSAYQTVTQAVTTFQSIFTQYNVQKGA